MALISRQDVVAALTRLGELAAGNNQTLELLLVGGGVMVLAFDARQSTHDLDVVILQPTDAASVRRLAARVAEEQGWAGDWLNDAAKGFLVGLSLGPVIFS
jgi:predicted nucleotidyltransferase